MGITFKSYIDQISPYEPGKPIDEVKRELGLSEVIKLASNENPLGIPESVKNALLQNMDQLHRYPDGGSWAVREKLAKKLNVGMDEIILGNGSNEIIEFVARGFIEPGDTVISSEYAFLCYPLLTQVCDGRFIEVPAKQYAYDLDAMARAITPKTRVVFLANPNNPTGTYFSKKEFDRFLTHVPEETIICLDEAYIDFVDAADYPNGADYFRTRNVIALRTFSKAYGLAGFRVGYALANKNIIRYFNKVRQPFNVNALAQIAVCAALDDTDYVQRTLQVNREGKEFLYRGFDALNLTYLKSQGNFILVNVQRDSKQFFQEILKHGVVIRDMKPYKLDSFVRVTVGLMTENEKLLAAFKKVLTSKP